MKDTSIFQGVVEFTDHYATQYRAVQRFPAGDVWDIYIKVGSAYVTQAIVRIRGKATPERILAKYNEVMAMEDDKLEEEDQ